MSSTPNDSFTEAQLDAQVSSFLGARMLVQSHIRSLVRDASLAEDIFQELWLRFERATRRGDLITNVPAWCRSAARLIALESWRQQGREQPTQDDQLSALVDQAYAEQDSNVEHWADHSRALTECLDQLPAGSHDLIHRRYTREQAIADIAADLAQSIGSVKTALCRLRLALANCVKKRLAPSL